MKEIVKNVLIIILTLFTNVTFCQTNENSQKLNIDYLFIEAYSIKELPYTDSTNFDNHKIEKTLTPNQVELLRLDQVFSNKEFDYDQSEIGINYTLNLSEKYKTVVFFVYLSEMELSSIIINYDSKFNIIDHKELAMDEIAESLFRKVSVIESNQILTTTFKYFKETIKEVETIEITDKGIFKIRH